MDISERLILIGIGFILGGVMGVVGLRLHLFPDYKLKQSKIVSMTCFIVGTGLIITGILKS